MNPSSLANVVGHADRIVQGFVATHQPPWVATAARGVMLLGVTWWGLTACVLAGGLVVLGLRAWRSAASATAAMVTGALVAHLGKALAQRPRPPAAWALVHPEGWSFPSTQATETAAIVAAFIAASTLTGWRRRVLVATSTALVLLVGVSMVSLGAHWPSDVLAGWLLGAAVGATVGSAVGRVGARRRPSA